MINLVVNGVSFAYPQSGDNNWGTGATGWASAVTSGMLSLAGGSFTLTAEVDFGTAFGLKTLYVKSESSNIAGTGMLRLSNTDFIAWRNSGNTADQALQPDADGILQYGGVDLVNLSASQTLTNKTLSGSSNTFSSIGYASLVLTGDIVNSDVSTTAAIAYSKLNLSTSIQNSDLAGATNVAHGGTGLTSLTAYALLFGGTTSTGVVQQIGLGTSGQVLTSSGAGALPSWASSLTNPMSAVGDMIIGGTSGAATRLAGTTSTTKHFLTQTGTGSASAAQVWGTIASADVPTLNQNTTGTAATITGTISSSNVTTSSFVAPTVQKFTSGSGTYTLPSSPRAPLYIRVTAVGAGGGGGGTPAANGSGGSGNTTFGTSLIVCNPGSGGSSSGGPGGAGGAATFGSGPVGVAFAGEGGGASTTNSNSAGGSNGGNTPFGGAGQGGEPNFTNGGNAATNSGSGGGSAGGPAGSASGAGAGGAGGYAAVLITAPASSYAYNIPTGGLGGVGSSGTGGNGAAGMIIVEEFYQ